MTIKNAIIVIGGLILISGLVGFFVWLMFFRMSESETGPGIEVENQPVVEVEPILPVSGLENVRGIPAPVFTREPVLKIIAPLLPPLEIIPEQAVEKLKELQIPVFPLPRPKSEEIRKIPLLYAEEFLERIQEAVLATEKKIEERSISAPTEVLFGASRQKIEVSIEEIELSLTPEEFNFLYPDYFIKSLREAQVLIKSYDPDYRIIAEIKTDSDVRRIQESTIFSLFSANMITKEEAERYLTTIRFTLPQLQITELKIKKANGAGISKYSEPPKLSATYEIMEKFLQLITVSRAKAKGPCGACFILPECFQVGPPDPVPGINTWTPFCFCNGCLHGQGCLDRCTGQSAIWDPMTGICGCG